MFKIGDKVRVSSSYYVSRLQGKEGIIGENNGISWAVKFDTADYSFLHRCEGTFKTDIGRYFSDIDLTLITSVGEQTKPTTFKLGDRVKVREDYAKNSRCAGEIATIVELTDEIPGLKFDNHVGGHTLGRKAQDGYGYYISIHEIELISTFSNFKVGDKIRIKKAPMQWSSSLSHNCPVTKSATPTYPFETEIQELKEETSYTAMKAGNYGWDLSGLIKDDIIELITTDIKSTINKPIIIMNTIKTTLKKLTRTEPEKSLIEVGFLDEHEEVTELGKEALINVLFDEKKKELKAIADQLLAEKRAEEAKKK